MKVRIQRIGNSRGLILPKPLLQQIGLVERELDISIEGDAIVLRRSNRPAREGWAEAAAAMAAAGRDEIVWPEFSNEFDMEWSW